MTGNLVIFVHKGWPSFVKFLILNQELCFHVCMIMP